VDYNTNIFKLIIGVIMKIIIEDHCDECDKDFKVEDPDFYPDETTEYGRRIIYMEVEYNCPECGKRFYKKVY